MKKTAVLLALLTCFTCTACNKATDSIISTSTTTDALTSTAAPKTEETPTFDDLSNAIIERVVPYELRFGNNGTTDRSWAFESIKGVYNGDAFDNIKPKAIESDDTTAYYKYPMWNALMQVQAVDENRLCLTIGSWDYLLDDLSTIISIDGYSLSSKEATYPNVLGWCLDARKYIFERTTTSKPIDINALTIRVKDVSPLYDTCYLMDKTYMNTRVWTGHNNAEFMKFINYVKHPETIAENYAEEYKEAIRAIADSEFNGYFNGAYSGYYIEVHSCMSDNDILYITLYKSREHITVSFVASRKEILAAGQLPQPTLSYCDMTDFPRVEIIAESQLTDKNFDFCMQLSGSTEPILELENVSSVEQLESYTTKIRLF